MPTNSYLSLLHPPFSWKPPHDSTIALGSLFQYITHSFGEKKIPNIQPVKISVWFCLSCMEQNHCLQDWALGCWDRNYLWCHNIGSCEPMVDTGWMGHKNLGSFRKQHGECKGEKRGMLLQWDHWGHQAEYVRLLRSNHPSETPRNWIPYGCPVPGPKKNQAG